MSPINRRKGDTMSETKLTALQLDERLKSPSPSAGAQLAARIRSEVTDGALAKGGKHWTSELTVAWAIAVADVGRPPEVVSDDRTSFRLQLRRLGDSDIYAGAAVL